MKVLQSKIDASASPKARKAADAESRRQDRRQRSGRSNALRSGVDLTVERERMDIGDEVNSILMAEPFMVTFVHHLKHYKMLKKDEEIIACTDGSIVEYGPKYVMLELPERTYICVHEIGHGIWLHSLRAMLWMLYNGHLFPALWNYAADVVINESIEASPMMRNGMFQSPGLFPPCRMKTTIHETMAEAIRVSGEKPPVDYSPLILRDLKVETLYEWLVWALFAMRRHRGQDPMTGRPQAGGGDSDGQDDDADRSDEEANARNAGSDVSTAIERMEREDAWDLRENLDEVRQKLNDGQTTEQIVRSIENQVNEARARIRETVRGMQVAGADHGSMIMALSSDLPKPTVPWDRIIRKVLDGAMGIRMGESYTRPGNATLCAMALRRRNLPVSRGMTIYSPKPRILVGLDVSGSMTGVLSSCFSEIWSMAQMKGADIDLMTWDNGIQEVMTITSRHDFDRILRRGVRGGGGTTVVKEVFDHAEQNGHKAIVMMTDGHVNIALPQKPRIPVIWAITPGGATSGLEEYGTIVRMARDASTAVDEAMIRMAK